MPQVAIPSTSKELSPLVELIFTYLFSTKGCLKHADSLPLLAQGSCCLGGVEGLEPEPICSW